MQKNLALKKNPEQILLIMMRYLGDVLLTTPLIKSIREAYQSANIDILVLENTAAILEGNPDINNVITFPNNRNLKDTLNLLKSLFRKYDLAICTQIGDRPLIISLIAASQRIAAVPRKKELGWWKRYLVSGWTEFDDDNTHTVLQHLKLASILGIKANYQLTPPTSTPKIKAIERTKYAVLHPHPKWRYKRWPIEQWKATGDYLNKIGLQIVLSGSGASEEANYVQEIEKLLPKNTINLAGKLSLGELAATISHARLFIGPDTGITHLAAATGIPVIAIYGPTNPVKWAPWPFQYQENRNPFKKTGNQHVNNIYLMQGHGDCVPCHQEGCEKHQLSYSKCLDTLAFNEIQLAINESLKLTDL